MSTPRHLRVAQSIKRELAEMILRGIKDERISGIVSITDVECSADCRRAKIFISVFGEEEQQQHTMEALNDHAGEIRGELCRRLQLRFAPEVMFKLDNSLERGAHVSALLNKISRGEI
ncbi:MAG: 30S ribosome-binding factor RbfA [Candidatus Obscuribacterales bacterium]|jgi:ribosome-binding factor A|nr:30S ribosome-binding factor RbfA [Candidatus Obscuribacterales bacterium]